MSAFPPRRLRVPVWLTLSLLAATGSSVAGATGTELADLSFEELLDVRIASVVGASKYEQKLTQAPSSVTIVDRTSIRRFGARDLSEVLSTVRGVYTSNDRNYSYLGIRGFLRPGDYNTRTLLLLDGHRMNEATFDSFYLEQNAMPDLDLVERIEVVRGPSSSVYGSNAFFGVINIVPRRGRDIDGAEVSVDLGNLDFRQARVTYGSGWGDDSDLLVSASISERGGNERLYFPEFDQRLTEDPAAANDGWVDDFDRDRSAHLYAAAKRGDLSVMVFASTREREIPTASFDTVFNAGLEVSQDDRFLLDAKVDREILTDTRWVLRSYLDAYRYVAAYPYEGDEGRVEPYLMNLDQAYAIWTGFDTHVVRRTDSGYTLLAGAEYRNNLRCDMFNYDVVAGGRDYYVDARGHSSTYAFFVETEAPLADWLRAVAGLRYDGGSQDTSHPVHPRLAAILKPWAGGALKLLYGSAFRAPNAYERDYLESADDLRSERIRTYEAVIEQYFGRAFRAAVSGYTYEVVDLISIGGDDAAFQTAINSGRTEARGIEAEFEARSDRGMLLRTSYALQRSKDTDTDEELSNSPQQLLKLQVLVPWREAFTSGLSVQYNSSVLALDGRRVPSFWRTDLTLFHGPIHPRLTVSATIFNLFDESYFHPGSTDHRQSMIEQDGRTWRIKLEYHF